MNVMDVNINDVTLSLEVKCVLTQNTIKGESEYSDFDSKRKFAFSQGVARERNSSKFISKLY